MAHPLIACLKDPGTFIAPLIPLQSITSTAGLAPCCCRIRYKRLFAVITWDNTVEKMGFYCGAWGHFDVHIVSRGLTGLIPLPKPHCHESRIKRYGQQYSSILKLHKGLVLNIIYFSVPKTVVTAYRSCPCLDKTPAVLQEVKLKILVSFKF